MSDQPNFPFDLTRLKKEIQNSARIMVLGGMDTGKTTLIRALNDNLEGLVLDGDLGQPEIGPPGLVSLGSYRSGMEDGYFVGSFTPRGNLVQVMTGIAKLLTRDTKRVLLDTDGWIEGEAARVYKGELINLVDPDVLILLQREDELEKFSTYLTGGKIIPLKAQEKEEKTRGERAASRIRKFKYYFSRSSRIKKDWEEVKIAGFLLGRGDKISTAKLTKLFRGKVLSGWKNKNALAVVSGARPKSRKELKKKLEVNRLENYSVERLEHRLVGLYREGDFVGEGTITDLNSDGLEILAPSEEFDLVKPGKEKVKPSGRSTK
ncbi:MAG: Clp1/GlmU family protein [Candidatus Bipolaricaulia bacterium]